MNKTVTVNIGGIVFHIDENAYERFKAYLEAIRRHFTSAEGRDEIMQDIESRIAEMFQERVKDSKQVITLDDVEQVTVIMGRPDQFSEESESAKEEKHESASTQGSSPEFKGQKRLFRNPDQKVLGGVCSGIAAYFDLDPVWIRLAYAISIFVFGSGFLLYIILWIIIPEAESSVEKLQMRGEPVNISNIEKNVQESGKPKRDNFVSRFFEGVGQLFKLFFLFIGKLLAIFFVFIGLVIAFGMFASMFALFKFPGTHYPEFFNHVFNSNFQFGLAFVAAVALIGIPFVMLAFSGVKMLFNIKRSTRYVGFTALGLWLAALVVCLVLGLEIGNDFKESQSVRRSITLMQPASNTLFLELEGKRSHEKEKYYDRWGKDELDELVFSENNELKSKEIKLDILKSNTDSFELEEIFYARGSSKKEAADRATHSTYAFNQTDSLMRFTRNFIIDKGEKYRGQKVQLILRVPVGKRVYLDQSLENFIYDIDNITSVQDDDMLNRTWEMTSKGLQCVDCTGEERTLGGNSNATVDIRGSDDESQVRIDKNGVVISGPDDEMVKIDSNGVMIRKDGKTQIIKDKGIHINVDSKK